MGPGYRENTLSIMQKKPALILNPGREKSLLRHHPWVFSGAIDRLDGSPVSGDTVDVLSSRGEFLARAAFSPCSQIRARVWTFADEPVDNAFLRGRILTAIRSRSSIPLPHDTGAFRLIHAESDGLPGLVVDRYGGTLVVQFLSAGAEFWRLAIAGILVDLTGLTDIYERSDADVRELEGLPARLGPLRGEPPQKCIITENGLQFTVDLAGGHKTGFYLDQRLTVNECVNCQPIGMSWIVFATPAGSVSTPSRAEPGRSCPWILLRMPWHCAARTWRLMACLSAATTCSRGMSSTSCANSVMKPVRST